MRVLLVDDDDALAATLMHQLTAQNYIVDRVTDGETGWVYGSTFDYDLVVLDWVLPQLDGIQLCQRLRNQGYGVPILLLTAKNEQTDKLKGLEAGADDYVVKPFDIAELLARIRALLRRNLTESAPILSWGNLCLDPVSCKVTYQGQQVALTAKEYSLLELFLRHSQQVFSASTLLDRMWSSEEFPSEATVRSHIRGLRRKLKTAGGGVDLIETVHGLGYRLKSQSLAFVDEHPSADPPLSKRQARYLEGITQAWNAHKSESIERWNYLVHISHVLNDQALSEQQQLQAQQMAHSLAGTLGTFGLMEGYRLSLQIEKILQTEGSFSPTQTSQLKTLITTLGHALDEPPQLAHSAADNSSLTSILMVDVSDGPYVQQLMALAVAQRFSVTIAASIESATQALSLNSPSQTPSELPVNPPDLVLINLVSGATDPLLDEPILQMMLQFIMKLAQCWPQLPVVVVTPQADFGNRLDLIRRGSVIVLEYPLVPADILEIITHATYCSYRLSKIMIVDDDAHALKQVIHLLQPWGFHITPLANSKRFWPLFTQVKPDLVILDIEMPHINGFELCQVLRSNPQWQHVPIMFLSIHADQEKQNQAFAIGADDYITKPVQGQNLAIRLLNRLKRYHVQPQWQKVAETMG
ncbi:MAG: response regulator [Cyanobacteria bacterium P01_E01_bin.6]